MSSKSVKRLNFATQGGYFSYHRVAAEEAAGRDTIDITPCESFAQVVGKSRAMDPGLGIIAVNNTLSGVVVNSAKQLIRYRPSELPTIVRRVDIGVALGLMGSIPQDVKLLNRKGVVCLGQQPALDQCRDFMARFLPKVELIESTESTLAITDMVSAQSKDVLAIGPTFAAQSLGAVLLYSRQINPNGHKTSFYVLQRDPTEALLPPPPAGSKQVTVLSIAFPDDDGEKEKVLNAIEGLELPTVRVIDFASGDYTRDANLKRRDGGLYDIEVGYYHELRYELCKVIARLKARYNDKPGPFSAKPLGYYYWPAEENAA